MEDGKGNNSEVDHAFCLEARLRTSKIVLRPIFLPLRSPFTPSFSPLFHSRSLFLPSVSPRSLFISSLSLSLSLLHPSRALSLFLSPYLFPSETSRCVRTNTSEKSFTLTNTDARSTSRIRPRLSFSPFLSLCLCLFRSPLFSLASLLLSNLTPRKRAHNRVSVLFNVGGLLLTNTSLKSSSGSFHLPLLLLPLPPPPPPPPLSSS